MCRARGGERFCSLARAAEGCSVRHHQSKEHETRDHGSTATELRHAHARAHTAAPGCGRRMRRRATAGRCDAPPTPQRGAALPPPALFAFRTCQTQTEATNAARSVQSPAPSLRMHTDGAQTTKRAADPPPKTKSFTKAAAAPPAHLHRARAGAPGATQQCWSPCECRQAAVAARVLGLPESLHQRSCPPRSCFSCLAPSS